MNGVVGTAGRSGLITDRPALTRALGAQCEEVAVTDGTSKGFPVGMCAQHGA